MKFQIVLSKFKSVSKTIISSSAWKKLFVDRIDEKKMREYQDQHRLMISNLRIF